jgi:putative transposase
MKKSRYTEEQIIGILKQSEAGVKTADPYREYEISATTYSAERLQIINIDVEFR